MSKNIEYVQSEVVGSEIVETATDSSKLGDLITEAWAQQYARSTGLPVAQPAVQVETEVVELKALLLALLRAVWKAPTRLFDGSTLGAAVNNGLGWLRSRLLGDTTYGIPAYPNAGVEEAKAVLRRRDMSSGVLFGDTPLPDGMSLVNFLCTGRMSQVTEITDDNNGWTLSSEVPSSLNVKKLCLGCVTMSMPSSQTIFIRTATNIEELELPNLKNFYFRGGNYGNYLGLINNNAKLKRLEIPNLDKIENSISSAGAQCDFLQNCTALEEFIVPKLSYIGCEYFVVGCTVLRKVVFGRLTHQWGAAYGSYANNFQNSTSRLVHLEFGAGTAISLNMPWWSPTMALRTDTDAEDYVDLREDKDEHGEFIYANNLEQFLANFSAYIIDRLAQRTASTTLTLTLSQAVRNVLTAEQEQAIANKYWNLSPANKTT